MNTPVQSQKTNAAIMNIRVAFNDILPGKADEKIERLSQVLSLVAPVILRNEGKLTRVAEEGIVAIFKSAESSLTGALDAFHDVSSRLSPDELKLISIGIHAGTVFLAEVGYGDFSVPVAVSDGLRVAWRLSEAAARYDSRIMMTKTALNYVRSFDTRYNCRKLGVFYLSNRDTEEEVYDMFDADPTNLKYRKKRSRIIFETGVDLFLKGEYLQSRNYFIELLKYDRNDKTSKEYVFMCDKLLSGQPVTPQDRCLEVW